jgi:hypothetical protein
VDDRREAAEGLDGMRDLEEARVQIITKEVQEELRGTEVMLVTVQPIMAMCLGMGFFGLWW